MIPTDLSPLANHIWQSTLCAAVAWLLTLAFRKNRAAVRYWLWLAASVKFLIPFSLLVGGGAQLGWRPASGIAHSQFSLMVDEISRPFVASAPAPIVAIPAPVPHLVPAILLGIWLCGFIIVLVSWVRWWRHIRAVQRTARPLDLNFDVSRAIPVMSSASRLEPGVFGIRRPVLLLPEGITERLTPLQLEAILAHELCHVRRRDNLTGAIHMLVEAIFWFHPLVRWIRTRLIEERERACDEGVLHLGSDPEIYAESILEACRFYIESPLPCMAGVTGADLKQRVERIVARRLASDLTTAKKLLLAAVGIAALAGPLAIGLANAPEGRAQSLPRSAAQGAAFEVASVKPAPRDAEERSLSVKPGGRLTTSNATVKQLVTLAYELMPFQLSGGPNWVSLDGFDIDAKAANPKVTPEQLREMVQRLLADRFQFKFHIETKELPTYALVVAKNGPKLKESKKDEGEEVDMTNRRGEMTGVKATMAMFAAALSRPLQRKVVDETGLAGAYTFTLRFLPDQRPPQPGDDSAPPERDHPSLFTAVQEQLGLALKASKGPVEVLIIDHVERPSKN